MCVAPVLSALVAPVRLGLLGLGQFGCGYPLSDEQVVVCFVCDPSMHSCPVSRFEGASAVAAHEVGGDVRVYRQVRLLSVPLYVCDVSVCGQAVFACLQFGVVGESCVDFTRGWVVSLVQSVVCVLHAVLEFLYLLGQFRDLLFCGSDAFSQFLVHLCSPCWFGSAFTGLPPSRLASLARSWLHYGAGDVPAR